VVFCGVPTWFLGGGLQSSVLGKITVKPSSPPSALGRRASHLFSNDPQQQQDDHNQDNQAHAATAVVTDARSHAVAAEPENKKQNDENYQ
jgi:hypothetical protein